MHVLECSIESDDSWWYVLECFIESDDSWCTFWSGLLNLMIPGVRFGVFN